MTSIQDSQFAGFAGQEISAGVRTNPAAAPLIPLDGTSNKTILDNLTLIGGLMPKCADVMIHTTKVFDSALDAYFTKHDAPLGAYIEQASFVSGAANKKNDGRCVPYGTVDLASQMNIQNFALDIPLSIYDREINMAVMSPTQASAYASEKMKTAAKTIAQAKYNAEVQIISDVVDGTRSISSHDSSDGTGSAVTYSANVTGYAGEVMDSGVTVAEITAGSQPSFGSSADAVTVVKKLRTAAADMAYESTDYNVLGVQTFCSPAETVLIMEQKTLDGLDDALSFDTDGRFPAKTAREYLRQNVCPNIVEIGSFAALPTNSEYEDKRLGAVLIEKAALNEHIQYNDVESQRCSAQRRTGYSWQYESTLSVYRGMNSAALLFDTQ